MIRTDIDAVITKLGYGYKIALAKQNNELLLEMGYEVLTHLLESVDDEDFIYTVEQLIIRCPELITTLHGVISETYPQYKDHIEKLIVLV